MLVDQSSPDLSGEMHVNERQGVPWNGSSVNIPTCTDEQGCERDDSSLLRYWSHYFPTERCDPEGDLVKMINKFKKILVHYFSKSPGVIENIEMQESILLNYDELHHLENGDLAVLMLEEKPELALNCLSLAATDILRDISTFSISTAETPFVLRRVRLCNYGNEIRLKNFRLHKVGHLVTFKGTIVRVSSVTPLIKALHFICELCTFKWKVYLSDGCYNKPTSCAKSYCKGKVISPSLSIGDVETIDYQQIRIQEKLADNPSDAGKIPRSVVCELKGSIIDSAIPGDVVSVTGVVKPLLSREESYGRPNANRVYYLYIDANNLTKVSSKDDNHYKCESYDYGEYCEFSKRDLYGIQEIFYTDNIFKLLVHSFCPSIYGHELVKAGIMLTLFGGRRKARNSRHEPEIRSDIHILMVGDPGLGKSQMLSAACKLASRGVFVCGNTCTTSGLTVTMLKDKESGEPALEAGALVLSDQGVCCIDEFDKMTDQSALLEVMEQQSISIAKSGIVCALPARTSIIAAANPARGHYEKSRTVSENLKTSTAILSRFDLIYIIIDNPDSDFDTFLSKHVAQLHSNRTDKRNKCSEEEFMNISSQKTPSHNKTFQEFRDYLKIKKGEVIDAIPVPILKKYVSYARTYVHPVLSQEAAKYIKEAYMGMRKNYKSKDSTPVTTRQLESLIRLCEARARAELRETATAQDARDALELMMHGIWETYSDSYGNTEISRSQAGNKRADVRRYVAHLHDLSSKTGNNSYTIGELERIATELKISTKPIHNFIYLLNSQDDYVSNSKKLTGYIINRGNKTYQLITL